MLVFDKKLVEMQKKNSKNGKIQNKNNFFSLTSFFFLLKIQNRQTQMVFPKITILNQ